MDYSEDPEPYNRQADEWQRGYEKQKVRIKELERLAYIGEHHHADLTWKARCEETQRQLDEARALVSKLAGVIQPCIVCCFAMARFGRYDAAFGVGAPMLCDQCAAHSLEDGEDWRACPPESVHVALRALAKEDGK